MKTKIRNFTERLLPPGASGRVIPRFLIFGHLCSLFYSFTFWHKYFDKYWELFTLNGETWSLSGEMMTSFGRLHSGTMTAFKFFAVLCTVFIIYYYSYYRQGSKSIYLMRRLPNRFELFKRTITMPLIMCLSFIAASALTTAIYYLLYVLITPDDCLLSTTKLDLWRFLL